MTKSQLHQLVDEFAELSLRTDVRTGSRLCVVLMHLQSIGYETVAACLSNQEYKKAHEYIDFMEVC